MNGRFAQRCASERQSQACALSSSLAGRDARRWLRRHRHCERSDAIKCLPERKSGLLRCARNDGGVGWCVIKSALLCLTGKSLGLAIFCPALLREIFCFRFSEICVLIRSSRPTPRGVSRSSRTRGGMRWTRRCRVREVIAGRAKLVSERGVRDERRCCGRRSRVVLAPHGRRQGPDGIAWSPTGLRGAALSD